ncbi:MAG: methyltransferase family protein [Candidatus Entotheonellia bacterium]
MKLHDWMARNAWFRFVGERRGGFSLLAVAPVVYGMLDGRDLPLDVFELRPAILPLVGVGLLVMGGLVRLWAAGYIRKSKEVTRAGPYSLVRHPLYLGTLLAWLGFLILSGNPLLGFQTFWLLLFAVYYPRMLIEEWRLTERFGITYENYRKEVAMLLPCKRVSYRPGDWSLRLAWDNKGFRLLCLIPVILLTIEGIEELRQGRFIFYSLQQLVLR